MHPRSPYYNNPPDFSKLIIYYEDLKNYIIYNKNKTKCTIDFYNPNALKALCCALLKQSFDLQIEIPIDHLIPRVPLRVNYCLWIEDLVGKKEDVYGIDIGCGSSCIYSLILCQINKNWKMLCSDIDDTNIDYANKNVDCNKMKDQIEVRKVRKDVFIKELIEAEIKYEFTMTNPPFFEDIIEAQGLRNTRKMTERSLPKSINTAKDFECIHEHGGEVGFVKKIVDESIEIGKQIRIYTSMFGKKSSFLEIKKYLTHVKGIRNISEAKFCQGNTMRWALAWSFNEVPLPHFNYSINEKKTKPLFYKIPNQNNDNYCNVQKIYDYLQNILIEDLEVEIIDDKNYKLLFEAKRNTWSNQRQKKRMELKKEKDELVPSEETKKRKFQTDFNDTEDKKKFKNSINYESLLDNQCIIQCEIELNHSSKDNEVYLQMCYKKGLKEYMHQILQFIRNKFENAF